MPIDIFRIFFFLNQTLKALRIDLLISPLILCVYACLSPWGVYHMLSLPRALGSSPVFIAHRTMPAILLETGQDAPSMLSFQGALVFQVARNWAVSQSWCKVWSSNVPQLPCIWQAVLLQTSVCSLTSWCGRCLKKKHGKVVSPKVKLGEELHGARHDKGPSRQQWTARAAEGFAPLLFMPMMWPTGVEGSQRAAAAGSGQETCVLNIEISACSSEGPGFQCTPAGGRPGMGIKICSPSPGVDWSSCLSRCLHPRT